MMASNKYAYEYACISACTNQPCSTAELIESTSIVSY